MKHLTTIQEFPQRKRRKGFLKEISRIQVSVLSAAQVDPHDKMRSRDVNKVASGEQAPAPNHEYGTVSPPPPPCCVKEKGKNALECEKLEKFCRSLCPNEWVSGLLSGGCHI
ncbi:putative cytochrome c oxidase subunit 6b-like [Mangifera indica]|uniref:putative cytochrome c oxidase subunit 6b-like n=1 Tax=Mangifera indica TaxID=29780 RepID=UPI001CFBE51C|nr:putative cytochrome c oxidase subunit 6b-like [Mangifera indica]